ncbi:5'/3'-nucleotidase SurE [Nonomuraea sp. NPDC050022]|uniref:5'/3'-nucleotidase SurE n=1 Tax=unclassified Nonomuraea TaxID=2593643 RepID=UPI0033D82C07
MFKRIALIPVLLLAFLGVANPAPAQAHEQRHLRILLTNDDGYTSSYLQGLRQKLIEAGHEVTVVAPDSDVSITGTAINAKFGTTLQATQKEPGVWAVGGSPSDAVAFGTRVVFAGNPPDLVVSGPNPGENVAATANYSGTVAATITAITGGIPAVAVSVARSGGSFPSADQSIAFAVKLVDRLAATSRGAVLPARTALNVNYPVTPNGKVTVAKLGTSLPFSTDYTLDSTACATCYRILPLPATAPDPVTDADRTLLAAGNVTITPLDGNWEAGPATATIIRLRLNALTP